jgi:hypothetical protein
LQCGRLRGRALVSKFPPDEEPSLLKAIVECADQTQRERFAELARKGGYDPNLVLGVWLSADHPERARLHSELERRELDELLPLAGLFRLEFNTAWGAGKIRVMAFDGNNEIEVNARQASSMKLDLVRQRITLPNGTVLTSATAWHWEEPAVGPEGSEGPIGKPQSARFRTVPTKKEALKGWIAKRYPKGIPAGMPQKQIARDFQSDTGTVVNTRTVRRALGGK